MLLVEQQTGLEQLDAVGGQRVRGALGLGLLGGRRTQRRTCLLGLLGRSAWSNREACRHAAGATMPRSG